MSAVLSSLLLGARRELQIETPLTREEALRRINARLVPWGAQGLRGRATEQSLLLYVVKSPFRQNSWRPVFDGRLESSAQGAVLKGTIGIHRIVQLILVVVLCAGVL